MRVTESHLRKWSLLQVSNGSCAVGMAMAGLVLGRGVNGSVAKIGGRQRSAVALRRSGGCCEMVVEHAHGLRQRRGPNAKSTLHKAHLAPDAGLQAPGASLSFAQGSPDFASLDRGLGRGARFETAHRLDPSLELSVLGLDTVLEIIQIGRGS